MLLANQVSQLSLALAANSQSSVITRFTLSVTLFPNMVTSVSKKTRWWPPKSKLEASKRQHHNWYVHYLYSLCWKQTIWSDLISCCLLYLCCLCREVFLIPEEMLLVPKVYSPIPTCLLHVINNDTGEELEMVDTKVATHYQPNKVCGSSKPLHFKPSCNQHIPTFPITVIRNASCLT